MSIIYKQRQNIKNPELFRSLYAEMIEKGYMTVKEVTERSGKRGILPVMSVLESLELYVYMDVVRVPAKSKSINASILVPALFPFNVERDKWIEENKIINGQIDYVSSASQYSTRIER